MIYPIIFLIGILSELFLKISTSILNKNNLSKTISNQSYNKNIFEENFLKKSLTYISDKIPADLISEFFSVFFILYLIFSNNLVNLSILINSKLDGSTVSAHLIIIAILGLIYFIFTLPLSIYDTFFIEKKHGFSTITVKTFIFDIIKIIILVVILGGLLLVIIFNLIIIFETNWWIYALITNIIYSLFIMKIFPTFIAPIFNKFTPLEDGELKDKIMNYAAKADFKLKNILISDASKRSKHSNAYFTGFGKNKQVVLYDTLIEQLTPDELSAVILHEIGHYKKKHIWIMFLIQTFITGIMLFFVQKIILIENFIISFNLVETHYLTKFIISSLFVQSFIWLLGIPLVYLSRKHEFDSDNYSSILSNAPEHLCSALVKLVKKNLSNPYPHPLHSILFCSHPTVTERINKLKREKS